MGRSRRRLNGTNPRFRTTSGMPAELQPPETFTGLVDVLRESSSGELVGPMTLRQSANAQGPSARFKSHEQTQRSHVREVHMDGHGVW